MDANPNDVQTEEAAIGGFQLGRPKVVVLPGGCCCYLLDSWETVEFHYPDKFTCCRRAANELAAQDAVAGLMALSNGQIQGAGVNKDSNSGDVVCRVKRTEYGPPIEGEYDDTGDP
ncbi:hypothetical protein [Oryza sativa Japonica Group]|uniref:Uncharacterized protein n=1 Tax=Oryza sativa subsp. japonica TaxID=39947 RepID=Q5JM46_ORYSJ|nr:hypothetical protein [Oryza sativa Japonica Group]BAD87461.1 hypothetical protein [Oryza sativa Japonica Group]